MSSNHVPSLSERTAKAGLWTVGGKLFTKCLDFISLLTLARFLGPGEFGVVAMAMTAVLIVEAVSEMPLSAALLNQQTPTDAMYDTAFSIALLRAFLVVLVLCALSWPLSLLYNEPRLIALQCALSFAPAMRGLISQRLVEYTRAMDFRRNVALDVLGKAGSLAIAVVLAVTTGSYWAIAFATISTSAIIMIASYILAPQRIRFSLSEWHLFADMVGWIAGGQTLSAINWQTDKIVLPRFVDIATFGRFTTADALVAIPIQAIIQPITPPVFSAFIAVRHNGDIGRVYLKASTAVYSFVGSILLMMAMLSQPIIHLVLGSKWEGVSPILTWLALAAAFGYLPTVLLPALAVALNRANLAFVKFAIEFCIKIPLIIVLTMAMKLQGMLIGHAISSALVLFTTLLLVRRLTRLGILTQLLSLLRPSVALASMAGFLEVASKLFGPHDSELYIFLNLSWVCSLSLAIFMVTNLALWRILGCPDGWEAIALNVLRKIVGSKIQRSH
ncbi:oligosaccharide flippase family protein [Rhizobium sp. CECT 9324]|uniref:oligosaccharide flippase family protein n=1 Tax=Rhizobium sp. CECT 9324 TaxID=2845820 RepID=UPI001EF9C23B|nr:oligosaccharide flippase family protein [Rhizobium sp. CECT 9324]CAH0342909.1 hypothetical protein RHI9324_04641 [Rhizobium sp. CECT 9324]